MRCAPVALFHLGSLDTLMESSWLNAQVTHGDPLAPSSCVILSVSISEIVNRHARDRYLSAINSLKVIERRPWQRLKKISELSEAEISSSGYTVHTLETAAGRFLSTNSFEEAVVRAANLGVDADAVAAVCGALAGAYFGYSAIPLRWRAKLKDEKRIGQTALASGPSR